jgi:hypothetical protein
VKNNANDRGSFGAQIREDVKTKSDAHGKEQL